MKVKDFLEWFADFDPESELEFDLFEEGVDEYQEFHTPLDVVDVDYADEIDVVFVNLRI